MQCSSTCSSPAGLQTKQIQLLLSFIKVVLIKLERKKEMVDLCSSWLVRLQLSSLHINVRNSELKAFDCVQEREPRTDGSVHDMKLSIEPENYSHIKRQLLIENEVLKRPKGRIQCNVLVSLASRNFFKFLLCNNVEIKSSLVQHQH